MAGYREGNNESLASMVLEEVMAEYGNSPGFLLSLLSCIEEELDEQEM